MTCRYRRSCAAGAASRGDRGVPRRPTGAAVGPHRRLLAFLALHPGPHERDALAARFWPDAPDPRANLRTAVWVFRRSLGDDAVIATRTSVALGPVTRDLDETEALERDEPGQPCPGVDDDWAEAARAGHLRRRIARLDGLAAGTDDPAEAARWSARRCALDPAGRACAPCPRRAPRGRGRQRRRARRGPRARQAGYVPSWASTRPRPLGRCWPGCAVLRLWAAFRRAPRHRYSAAQPSWPRSPRPGPRRETGEAGSCS